MTFVFTDVVGSTQLFEEYGDRYVRALGRLLARTDRICASHAGSVVKHQGDGSFLVFCSAVDAIAAARALQDGSGVTAGDVPTLELRIGLHTGDAVAVDGDYVSLAVHVAARVCAAARAGQILASQQAVDGLGSVDGFCVGEFALKGITGPVTIWRLAGGDEAPNAVRAKRTNVAASTSSFVGRAEAVEALRVALHSAGVVTVVGPGGVGKTRLVSEMALAEAAHFDGGVWLVELGQIDSASEIGDSVAAALGVAGDAAVIAKELNARGSAALIVDNCEHLIDDAAALIDDLSHACPDLRVVATSREALGIPGERVMRLRTFSDDPAAAAMLFVDRATSVGATDLDPVAVQRICALLDGLPLAIELAAAYAADLPLRDLAALLERGEFSLSRRGGLQRQRSLENLVAWSVDRLEPADADALLALSTLPAGFDVALASAVCGRSSDGSSVIARLHRRSLVDLEGARYRLLHIVRQVARRRLADRVDLDHATHVRLLEYCLARVPRTEMEIDSLTDQLTAQYGATDLALTFETALAWGLDHGAPNLGAVLRGLRSWTYVWGTSTRARELCARVMAEAPAPSTADGIWLAVTAIRILTGRAITVTSEPLVTHEAMMKLVNASREVGDLAAQHECLSVGSDLLCSASRFAEARQLAHDARQIAEQMGDATYQLGKTLIDLGVIDHVAGNLEAAEDSYRRAVASAVQHGHPRNRVTALLNLGELLLDGEAAEAAMPVLAEGIGLAGPSQPGVVMAALLAEALHRLGRHDESELLGREAVDELLLRVSGDPSMGLYLNRLRTALHESSPAQPR